MFYVLKLKSKDGRVLYCKYINGEEMIFCDKLIEAKRFSHRREVENFRKENVSLIIQSKENITESCIAKVG